MKKCINCKRENKDNDIYCRNCGCLIQSDEHYIFINVMTALVSFGLLFVIILFIVSYFV